MRVILTAALTLVLATAPLAHAAFSDTFPDEDAEVLGVDAADSSLSSIESVRHFRLNDTAAVPVYVKMLGNEGEAVYLTEAGYKADVYLSTDNGTSWTQVAQDVNHTDPSASVDMTSTDEPAVRVVLHFPAENRSVRVVPVAFHVALQDAGAGGQNGGVADSAFTHSVSLNFYDDATDADGDELADAWEYEHFGALDDPNGAPGADPDGDGATNADEEAAGTDPNDDQDTPEPPPDGGDPPGGGGVSNPEGVGWIILLGYLVLFAALLGALALSRHSDHRVLAFGGWFAALWTVSSVALWLMDTFGPGNGWTPWAYPRWNIGPVFWTAAVATAALGGSALAMTRQDQTSQRRTAATVAGSLVVLLGSSLLYLGWLDVPTLLG